MFQPKKNELYKRNYHLSIGIGTGWKPESFIHGNFRLFVYLCLFLCIIYFPFPPPSKKNSQVIQSALFIP